MLKLDNIVKNYSAGDSTVEALKGVSLEFRRSEFVAVLGQSGCGKTTLLNIIGGLDRYTSGDLIINGRSTKQYKDRDWDSYRNHSIGFVFQSYNLIPHQSVLSNVELALTLSGVPREERRRRAKEALEKVGLGDQINKRPNQMSGGQMQRVAIARALVNDPDILLADEPTGALDSETSVQIMNILKEISADKLIIMVTHNPELAEQYSNRIIRLLDGKVVDDTNPYTGPDPSEAAAPAQTAAAGQNNTKKAKKKDKKKTSMSFFTAVSLSFNNLLTKKTRTFLTSFAGSIGIIGIALILSLSNGVNRFINTMQQDTLSSYPISVKAESMDASAVLTALMSTRENKTEHELDKVYSNAVMYELVNSINSSSVQKNNLSRFKEYLDKQMDEGSSDTELYKYASAVRYGYDFDTNIYTKDEKGNIIDSDMDSLVEAVFGTGSGSSAGSSSGLPPTMSGGMLSLSSMQVWEEMLAGSDGEPVHELLKDQYDVIYGSWPEKFNEVVLVVDSNNEITDMTLYALGLKTAESIKSDIQDSSDGKQIDAGQKSWSYKKICDTEFRLVLSCDKYSYDEFTGTYLELESTEAGLKYLYDNGIPLKVTGIIRPDPDASATMLSGSIGYTAQLTEYVVGQVNNSDIVKAQLKSTDTDLVNGKQFKPETELTAGQKASLFKERASDLDAGQKAQMYKQMAIIPDENMLEQTAEERLASMSEQEKTLLLISATVAQTGMDEQSVKDYIAGLDSQTVESYVKEAVKASVAEEYTGRMNGQTASISDAQAAAMFDRAVGQYDDETLAQLFDRLYQDEYSEYDYVSRLKSLGYVDLDSPASVSIYSATFDDKKAVEKIISDYNAAAGEDDKISYTDYIAAMMSFFTTLINAISYVLIAFVSISLVVSSIMIGIITYISVLERTKEIGILRSIGASKKDISRVFNAETLIVGFASGAIGIIATLLLCIPINLIIHAVTGITTISAALPFTGGVILVAISMLLTFISGIIPSHIAAKKDPVVALRTE